MLSHYRILDLTDDRGHMAGHILAQLGAEVILVEPPEGIRTRHQGPYLDDTKGPDQALAFHAFNRGKASVIVGDSINLDELAASADALITCGADSPELDLAELRAGHPHLVTATISAFGDAGPKANWAATDLTVVAASGTMSLTGDRDRAPVRIGPPQSWLNAGADAAGAVLIALHERQRSGEGQHISISAQQSFAECSQFFVSQALVGGTCPTRQPGAVQLGDYVIPWVYECADGYVTVTFLLGAMIGPYTARIVQWMHDEAAIDDDLLAKNWADLGIEIAEGRDSMETFDRAIQALTRFAKTKSKAQLLERGLADNLLIAPITTTADVLALDQLADRGYWQQVDLARANGTAPVTFPGSIAKTNPPLPDLDSAPTLGADTLRITEQSDRLPSVTPESAGSRAESRAPGPTRIGRPLEGLRVLDFMWAVAGPAATRTLADYGATVVKIESESRPDVIRGVNPFIGSDGGQENALQFHTFNAGKLDLTLDLSVPEAKDVVLDLVRWCDVLTESFSPKAMANWGLSYQDLLTVNPNLIMFSSCLMGQTGPMRLYAGFGTMAAAIAGFYPVTGWPDRIPAGPFTAYTDYISPRMSVALIMAAVSHRDRTGAGQHIDFAQLEGALHYLGPEFLEQSANGRTTTRRGNADTHLVPHGVYPATGDDRWIAIVCETDEQWSSLADLIGATELGALDKDERRARELELDQRISTWSSTVEPTAGQEQLQALGIPAHMVNNAYDLIDDPQLLHRQHFQQVPHPVHGRTWVQKGSTVMTRTPSSTDWGGPMFGQHNMEVLESLLGYDGERIAELVIAGAIA